MQVGGGKAQVCQRGQALARGGRRQVAGVAFNGIGLELEGIQPLQPSALVGGKHAVGPALLGQQLVTLQQHLVFVVAKSDAQLAQGLGHALVTFQGLGLVVAVGQHLLHAQRLRQLHDARQRRAVAHDEPAAGRAAACGQLLQAVVQLQHAGVDELHAPVAARGQRIQDVGVEHEGAVHALMAAQRVVERGVVVATQVAAQPHQGAGGRSRHAVAARRYFFYRHGPFTRTSTPARPFAAHAGRQAVPAGAGGRRPDAAKPLRCRPGPELPPRQSSSESPPW